MAGANSTFGTVVQLDAGVTALAASAVNQMLSGVTTYANGGPAFWNSSAGTLFTAPTGNGATLLMGTLVNNTPGPVAMLK